MRVQFLNRLTTLFTSTHTKAHGSVFLSQKPLSAESNTQVLIRATDGLSKTQRIEKKQKRTKLATVVDAAELDGFYARYAEVCKKGMEGLRKRDKRKAKEKAKAKKKGKGGAAPS